MLSSHVARAARSTTVSAHVAAGKRAFHATAAPRFLDALTGAGAGQTPLTEEFGGTPRVTASSAVAPTAVQTTTLDNGVRVVSQDNQGPSSSIGLYVAAGSRYERVENEGVAHFLSRMAFSSTESRTHFRVVRDAESAGVVLNGEVGRESIVYGAEGSRDVVDDAVSFIGEAVTEPLVAHWEVSDWASKLKGDLSALQASPDVVVSEALHAAAYGDASPLGHSMYAREDQIGSLSSDVLQAYMSENYHGARMVLAGSNVDHSTLVAAAEGALGGVAAGTTAQAPASAYVGGEVRVSGATPLTHMAVAFQGPSSSSSDVAVAAVARALLGGDTRGSRLGLAASGDHDYLRAAFTFAAPYADSGLFGIYGCAAGADADKLGSLLASSFSGLAESGVSDDELARARNLAKAAVFGVADRRAGVRGILAQATLAGTSPAAADHAAAIDGVSAADLKSFASALLKSGASVATVGEVRHAPRLSTMFG